MADNRFVVLSPVETQSIVSKKTATRLHSLEGKVLGIINNGKMNSDVFLRALVKQVRTRYRLQGVIWVDKINASGPMTPEMLERLKGAHAVVAGVGD